MSVLESHPLDDLECESNDDWGENELCFGNTCEELGNIQESWILTTFGTFENGDCTGEIDNDEDFINSIQLQIDLYDNNLIVESICWFNGLIGYGYWSADSTGYIFTEIDEYGDTEDTSYILEGNSLYTIDSYYGDCITMEFELGTSDCEEEIEETCDPMYAGSWEWTAYGNYENGDCTGELELSDYDGYVVLYEDCTMELYDTWCENPQDSPGFCTGEWFSEENVITMGPVFYRDWVVEDNIMTNDIIVTYMPDPYDESTWYDVCTYNEYTFMQEENLTDIIQNDFYMYDAYPNPFNPVTTISFHLTSPMMTTLTIFDIKGKLVSTLLDQFTHAGNHQLDWNADGLPNGVYFVKLDSDGFSETQKLMLVK